ncbi:hypothetical protein [Sandaracinus amylolyticus]|uniref:hypothetical protein n=1 Tax=Sandaracinus amylolyticus TaxID=927083 RepID=UPI001F2E63EA|nr:hypothetical protein [Sandaracinus amylolyticus]UJR86964.1 Hypothetical protein I5071_90650 [Sandaracinus amylolyticus]
MERRTWKVCLLALALAACGGGSADPDAGTTNDAGARDAQPNGGDGSTDEPDASTSAGALTCTTGSLLSGHPEHDAEPGVHANDGDPLRGVEGRPLGWREPIFVGDRVVTVVGQEVWASDLSEASPTVHRVAGVDSTSQQLLDGPCASARFANLQDLAADAEGSLFVMDQTGNAVLKITDPFDPSACEVHFWAGTSVDTTDITPVSPPNVGETEGPGATAQFALPGRMTIDQRGDLYVWDEGNASIRRIANDAAHTVSTLASVESTYDGRAQDVIVDSMLVLDGVLYLYAHDTANQVILEAVRLSDGTKSDVLRGRADVLGFDSSASLQVGGMTTDGEELFVYFKGLIFGVTLEGATRIVAGDEDARSTIEFESGYDPAVPHPVDELHLANRAQYTTAGADSWLAIDENDDLYFVGSVLDPYVVRIDCSR